MQLLLTKLMLITSTGWWPYLIKPLLLLMLIAAIYTKGYTDASNRYHTHSLEKAWRQRDKADALRADQQRHDANPERLRQNDGFRRD